MGMVAHICNPSIQEAEVEVCEFQASLSCMQDPFSKKVYSGNFNILQNKKPPIYVTSLEAEVYERA
jgi:hypothetical protein